jgi:hypothetical protein
MQVYGSRMEENDQYYLQRDVPLALSLLHHCALVCPYGQNDPRQFVRITTSNISGFRLIKVNSFSVTIQPRRHTSTTNHKISNRQHKRQDQTRKRRRHTPPPQKTPKKNPQRTNRHYQISRLNPQPEKPSTKESSSRARQQSLDRPHSTSQR